MRRKPFGRFFSGSPIHKYKALRILKGEKVDLDEDDRAYLRECMDRYDPSMYPEQCFSSYGIGHRIDYSKPIGEILRPGTYDQHSTFNIDSINYHGIANISKRSNNEKVKFFFLRGYRRDLDGTFMLVVLSKMYDLSLASPLELASLITAPDLNLRKALDYDESSEFTLVASLPFDESLDLFHFSFLHNQVSCPTGKYCFNDQLYGFSEDRDIWLLFRDDRKTS